MKNWQLQDAKARFSELLNITLKDGPQVVTRRGIAAAVLVPIEDWRCLLDSSRPSLEALLLGPGPRSEDLAPARRNLRRRAPELRKPKPHSVVLAWITELQPDQIYLSAVTIGDLQTGIELTRGQNSEKADAIALWVDQLAESFQISPMDAASASGRDSWRASENVCSKTS